MFWPLNFWGERPPQKKSDWRYKTQLTSDHRASFCRDWPTELGDNMVTNKNSICSKTQVRSWNCRFRAD